MHAVRLICGTVLRNYDPRAKLAPLILTAKLLTHTGRDQKQQLGKQVSFINQFWREIIRFTVPRAAVNL